MTLDVGLVLPRPPCTVVDVRRATTSLVPLGRLPRLIRTMTWQVTSEVPPPSERYHRSSPRTDQPSRRSGSAPNTMLSKDCIGDPDGRFQDRRIFLQIAAYRDADLPRTIRSAIDQASDPTRLRFGICHQFDDASAADLDEWRDDPRVTVDPVPAVQSRGVGWARARCQTLWNHEPYMLQIDAHTRFAPSWDDRLVAMLKSVDSDRPILTNYPLGFTVGSDGQEDYELAGAPRRLGLDPSGALGPLRQRSESAPPSALPGRHPFVAAGNMFTVGRFCRDVPADPDIYFEGEEISLAVRAYTHGYDLYYPNECVLWHWYDHPFPLHWQDHGDHHQLEQAARRRLRRLLAGDNSLGHLGLGRARTVAAYEHFAGVSLRPLFHRD